MGKQKYGKVNRRRILVQEGQKVPFHNQVDYCIGTGRMGLALQKEYQEQLKLVQEYIGFQHIRGHGLFTDDMAVYQESEENGRRIVEYNYTYLDRVMDSYLELGLKPFLELGFMPEKMASGTQTVFYWKGNVTPPKSYEDWKTMVQALLRHLLERYGETEVLTWPIEVWNEPNLPGFWKGADRQEYFKLFRESFTAIKEVDSRFRVGGPAVCGGSDEIWIKAFMEFCHTNHIPVDFVTRHHYTTEFPVRRGHYGYAQLQEDEAGFANLRTTRDIIDSYPEYKGLEIHITEFNTSYIPNCPLHDTNQNAAYIAGQLSRLGEGNESYSYWTFGDIFEEQGVPFTPFHGGFGLVANGCIPKPVFWSFVFFKKLKQKSGYCMYKDDNCVIMKLEDGSCRGVAWNRVNQRSGCSLELYITLPVKEGEYSILTERVDEDTCNPLKLWHDMGEPANPSREQVKLLQQAARPFVRSDIQRAEGNRSAASASLELEISLPENAVVYFEAKAVQPRPDRGYEYDYVMQYQRINPLTGTDCPDPDVIRVEDTYYMVNTTMHFMPGCELLRSYDLIHWEHAAYVYDTLDSTPGQRLEGEKNIYGKGMWAASLRYHKGCFYICFVANDTQKTYLYTSRSVEGPWEKHNIEGFYHDASLLFDEDERVYIAYGNREIHITELKPDLSGPLEGGLDRIAVRDTDTTCLGYEGTHFYKINGKYYLFFIHSLEERWFRTESCFVADSLTGEFTGGDVVTDDRGYCNQGVAQGAIVDTPEGKWYAILFQDSGAVGRIPILLPVEWRDDFPVFGRDGKVPEFFPVSSTRPGYVYTPLMQSDDFKTPLKSCWQFNHEPDWSFVIQDTARGSIRIVTDKLCRNLAQAKNTLTQRMLYPGCAAEVTVDYQGLQEGDYAGLCVLQGCYGMIAVTRRQGGYYLVMKSRPIDDEDLGTMPEDQSEGVEWALAALPEAAEGAFETESYGYSLRLRIEADFTMKKDEARFFYCTEQTAREKEDGNTEDGNTEDSDREDSSRESGNREGGNREDSNKKACGLEKENQGEWRQLGITHKMAFKMDHFTGARFGLFVYSTKHPGGSVEFSDFRYEV
ncbi:MAG: family 43 glycosylhydrolase [Roseburia sp.]|nr:family 43 glycosylhydrolase [Roseburia sp.]